MSEPREERHPVVHPTTGETQHEFSIRRVGNTLKDLWLCDDGHLIEFPTRRYPPQHPIWRGTGRVGPWVK